MAIIFRRDSKSCRHCVTHLSTEARRLRHEAVAPVPPAVDIGCVNSGFAGGFQSVGLSEGFRRSESRFGVEKGVVSSRTTIAVRGVSSAYHTAPHSASCVLLANLPRFASPPLYLFDADMYEVAEA